MSVQSDNEGISDKEVMAGLAKGLDVLAAMNRHSHSTLHLLNAELGIPKSSLSRILRTLELKGMVRRGPGIGCYSLTENVCTLSAGFHGEPKLLSCGAPVLDRLTAQLKWPAAAAMPQVDAMVVRYSTIPRSPLALLQSSINMRLCPISRALGKAYLAFCDTASQREIVNLVNRQRVASNLPAWRVERVLRELGRVVERGYALRDPDIRPVSSTIAVPVYEGDRVLASIGITWITSAFGTREAVRQLLPPLLQASSEISARLNAL